MKDILVKYWGKYKNSLFLTPVFVLLESAVGLILPALMSNIVDVGVATGDKGYIVKCGVYMILLALVGLIAGFFSTWNASRASNGFGSNLRVAMYRHMQDFSFADIDRFSTASLITRTTSDVRTLQMAIQMFIRTVIQAPFQLIVALIIVIGYSPKLALIYFISIPVLFICVTALMRITHKLFTAAQEKLDNMNSDVQENLTAIRVVKAFVREKYERKKFKAVNDDLMNANVHAASRAILMMPMATIILNSVTLVIYWVGGVMVGNGVLLSGELLAVISYLTQIMFSVMMFSMALMQYTRARACGARVSEVLNAVPDIQDKPGAVERTIPRDGGSVEFDAVTFRYSHTGTGEDVLKDVSFSIAAGETVGIVGGTGSGKSSLVNLIPRFYDVKSGAVRVNGVDVRDYRIADLRAGIGMVLQNNVLFSGTIRENLKWGNENATDAEITSALESAQALDFVMGFPEGLDSMITQGGTNVSGGQKQRLCIARAMLRRPAILILDDSTSAVDSDTESRIRESFTRELGQCTVFIIAQRISSVVGADKIIVLDEDGRVAAVGSHADLMESCEIYQDIYTSQMEGVLSNG